MKTLFCVLLFEGYCSSQDIEKCGEQSNIQCQTLKGTKAYSVLLAFRTILSCLQIVVLSPWEYRFSIILSIGICGFDNGPCGLSQINSTLQWVFHSATGKDGYPSYDHSFENEGK